MGACYRTDTGHTEMYSLSQQKALPLIPLFPVPTVARWVSCYSLFWLSPSGFPLFPVPAVARWASRYSLIWPSPSGFPLFPVPAVPAGFAAIPRSGGRDRKSTRLNHRHTSISSAVFRLKKKTQ